MIETLSACIISFLIGALLGAFGCLIAISAVYKEHEAWNQDEDNK